MDKDLIKFIIKSRKESYLSNKKPKIDKRKSYLTKKSFEYQNVYYDKEKISKTVNYSQNSSKNLIY